MDKQEARLRAALKAAQQELSFYIMRSEMEKTIEDTYGGIVVPYYKRVSTDPQLHNYVARKTAKDSMILKQHLELLGYDKN